MHTADTPMHCACSECMLAKTMAILAKLVDDAGGSLTFDLDEVSAQTHNLYLVFDGDHRNAKVVLRFLDPKELAQHLQGSPSAEIHIHG